MRVSKPWKPAILPPMFSERFQAWAQRSALFTLGFFALVAQTVLLRAFLTTFEGHEFALGLFFGSWLLWITLGALVARLRAGGRERMAARWDVGLLLYLPAFLLQHHLLLHARDLLGVAGYELFPWLPMLGVAALANGPVSFVTGFLFTLACRAPALPVARVYVWEALGSAAGGAAITLWLAWGGAEEDALLICAALLLLVVALHRAVWARLLCVVGACVWALAAGVGAGADWQWANDGVRWQRLLPQHVFQGAFATPQARYLFGGARGQFHVVAGGSVVETVPNDEPASARIALLLAQQPAARRLLLVGPDGLASIRQLLRLPQIESVVWLHPDPEYPQRVLAALPAALRPADPRFRAPPTDVRAYLQRSAETFDAVLLNVPDATTLIANRYLTEEFFRQLQPRVHAAGVVGVRLAGGENYLGGELAGLGASLYTTLNGVFPHLALKPGDESWLFAATAPILTEDGLELSRRWCTIPEAAQLYPREGVLALMPRDRIQFQWRAYRAAAERLGPAALRNTDAHPLALSFQLLLLGKQYGWSLPAQFFTDAARVWLAPVWLLAVLLFAATRITFMLRKRGAGGASSPGVFEPCTLLFSTGLVGMATCLLLMALYQFRFGALFLHVGLIAALFMLGLTLGGRLGVGLARQWPQHTRVLLALTLLAHLVLLGSLGLGVAGLSSATFGMLFLLAGIFQGVYVPLAVARLQATGASAVASGAAVAVLDNLGGAVGGGLAGVVLLPWLGVGGAVPLLLAGVALNFLAVLPWPPSHGRVENGDAADRWLRRAGYVVAGALLWLLAATGYARHTQAGQAQGHAGEIADLLTLARELLPDATVEPRTLPAPNGRPRPFLVLQRGDQTSYLLNSDLLTPPVAGYGGPLTLALLLRADGTLSDLRFVQHYETPSYLRRIAPWLAQIKSRSLTHEHALAGVDAMSGASYTTRAVLRTLRQTGPAFAEKVLHQTLADRKNSTVGRHSLFRLGFCGARPGPLLRDGLLAVICLLPLALRWLPRRSLPVVRWLWLAVVVGVVGICFNAQYSLHHVTALLRGEIPPLVLNTPFLLIVVVPLLVALVGNYYCGWLCPCGAAQEWAALLTPPRWRLDPRKQLWRWTRWLKFALLAAAACALALGGAEAIQRADPLTTIFSGFAERPTLYLAMTVLLASIFFGRFWCRNLCPTGAFLGWLGAWRPLRRLAPQTAPAMCDYGVRQYDDLDCLQCDRCRRPAATARAEPEKARLRPREWIFLLLVAATTVALVREFPKVGSPGRTEFQTLEAAQRPPADLAAMKKITEQIRQKKLSDHEAQYYKRITQP